MKWMKESIGPSHKDKEFDLEREVDFFMSQIEDEIIEGTDRINEEIDNMVDAEIAAVPKEFKDKFRKEIVKYRKENPKSIYSLFKKL